MVIVSGENSRSLHIIMGVCACGRRGEEEEQKQKRSSLSQSTSLSRHRLLEQVDTPALILFAAQASPLNLLHDTDGLIYDAIVTTTNLILDRSEHTSLPKLSSTDEEWNERGRRARFVEAMVRLG
jgi:hypothetical protein